MEKLERLFYEDLLVIPNIFMSIPCINQESIAGWQHKILRKVRMFCNNVSCMATLEEIWRFIPFSLPHIPSISCVRRKISCAVNDPGLQRAVESHSLFRHHIRRLQSKFGYFLIDKHSYSGVEPQLIRPFTSCDHALSTPPCAAEQLGRCRSTALLRSRTLNLECFFVIIP